MSKIENNATSNYTLTDIVGTLIKDGATYGLISANEFQLQQIILHLAGVASLSRCIV